MRASSSSSISETFLPLSQYSPWLGVSRQPIRFINVDLPEPDGPMIAMYSPRGISNDTPCRACTDSVPIWYVFQMLRIEINEDESWPSTSTRGWIALSLSTGGVIVRVASLI